LRTTPHAHRRALARALACAALGGAALACAAALAACDPDEGAPTGPVITQDAGADADADAGVAPDGAGGAKANGDDCTTGAECQSGVCFAGGKSSYCSLPCTPADAVTVCAGAPFTGQCNMQGFCRRPN
jgi:hypothetical protein